MVGLAERTVPRVVKSAADRQDEILDVAQQLFVRQGYVQTTVQSIIDGVGIAKGTFYHHFRSKSDVLDALVVRLIHQLPPLVQPLLDDPGLGAIDVFIAFHARVNAWKVERATLMLELDRALHAGTNSRLLEGLRETTREVVVPVLVRIVERGVSEGVFDTPTAQLTADIVWTIVDGLSRSLAAAYHQRPPAVLAALQAIHTAHAQAVERVLGAPRGSLVLVDDDTLAGWLLAASQPPHTPTPAQGVQPRRRAP